jgi:hypothetical protein
MHPTPLKTSTNTSAVMRNIEIARLLIMMIITVIIIRMLCKYFTAYNMYIEICLKYYLYVNLILSFLFVLNI